MQQDKQNYKMNSNFQQADELPQEESVPNPIRKSIVVLGAVIGAGISYVSTFVEGQFMLMMIILFGAVIVFRQMGSRSLVKGLPFGAMLGGALAVVFFVGLVVYQKATGGGLNTVAVMMDMGKAIGAVLIGFLVKRVFDR